MNYHLSMLQSTAASNAIFMINIPAVLRSHKTSLTNFKCLSVLDNLQVWRIDNYNLGNLVC